MRLLLEDDPILGECLRDFVRCEGHEVDSFASLAEVKGLGQEPFDQLLVDRNPPDGSGLDWIASLHRHGTTPRPWR